MVLPAAWVLQLGCLRNGAMQTIWLSVEFVLNVDVHDVQVSMLMFKSKFRLLKSCFMVFILWTWSKFHSIYLNYCLLFHCIIQHPLNFFPKSVRQLLVKQISFEHGHGWCSLCLHEMKSLWNSSKMSVGHFFELPLHHPSAYCYHNIDQDSLHCR